MTRINVTVDGVSYSDEVVPRTLLVQYLREALKHFHNRFTLVVSRNNNRKLQAATLQASTLYS